MKNGLLSSPYYVLSLYLHEPDAHGQSIVKLSTACSGSGGCAQGRHDAICLREIRNMENRLQPLYRYRWSKSGVFNIIFKMLLSSLHAHGLVDWSATALDGRNIRALRCAVGAQKNPDISGVNGMGRSSGGFSTKIHLATDGSGLPFNIVLSPGQAHERQFALRLLDGIGVQRQNGSMKRRGHTALANKAYSRHALRNELKNKGYKNSHSPEIQ